MIELLRFISSYPILGKPLIMYTGITTLILFILTGTIAYLFVRGIYLVPFKWHPRMAFISFVVAFVHTILGLSTYF